MGLGVRGNSVRRIDYLTKFEQTYTMVSLSSFAMRQKG